MKKLFVLKSVWQFVEAALFVALGIVTIVFSNNETYWKVIGYVTGALLAVDGLLRIVMYFVNENVDAAKVNLIICISEVTLAVFIFICSEVVVYYFTLLVAILLLVLGFVSLVDSIVKIVKKTEKVSIAILRIIVGGALIALGIVALCFFPYNRSIASNVNTISIMLIISGIITAIAGVALAIFTAVCIHRIKKLAHDNNEEIAKLREEKRSK